MTPRRPGTSGPAEGVNRRSLLGGGLAGAALASAAALTVSSAPARAADAAPPGELRVPFHGRRQPGVVDPPPPWSTLVALDLAPGAGRDGLDRLMRVWTDDIARLMDGSGPITDQEPELAARTAGLTVTVGWGPELFDKAGIPGRRPGWLAPLPPLAVDDLDPAWTGGDLVLQIAAHSPVTVAHARRHLTGAAGDLAGVRWVQPGFREPMERHGWPMRNLFGQVDGTVQPATDGPDDPLLWIGADGPAGWRDGTSMVVRRIAMDLADWDRADRHAREHAVGRRLADGAPLTGGGERTPTDLSATLPSGLPVIDRHAHVRRAAAQEPHERFLRRPYNYDDPLPGGGHATGLVFTTFQADPVRQFLPVQRRLAEADLLNLWTRAVGSAVFAVLPGSPEPGSYLGRHLLA